MNIFEEVESQVRSYSRSFPTVFTTAKNARLQSRDGQSYIDFLAGAGTLNYGHNNDHFKQPLLDYIESDGITHGLDMYTGAKEDFLNAFNDIVMGPRDMDYKVQFTGPTGTNAVEVALKIARKAKGRTGIVSFTNGYHGCTLGSQAVTGNKGQRSGAVVSLPDVTRIPYDEYGDENDDFMGLKLLDQMLSDPGSGVEVPAGVIVETVQGEGGLNAARMIWLQQLESLCRKHDMLLIIDDIQAGCGRTGTFFSFEPAGIKPDIVTLSKSLSGYGLPFAITLLRPELDNWEPAEHNGTFRGNNLAFITARVALEKYWQDDAFSNEINEKAKVLETRFQRIIDRMDVPLTLKGRGMMRGISTPDGDIATAICKHAFANGLIVETSGSWGEVVKCLCPLTIPMDDLKQGLDILEDAFEQVLNKKQAQAKAS
ncbi:diaminobutyrate--2-oxoglutarate transaminase [Aliidiomarina halalkaliphila]|uniref:Diaminobutyrate--2-oxoglutarate transaminase n=1 Tax=Aliidiomarina halalkaliphila TaxID=2593535 RepID=A0A552X2P0_9GAMM|nr:diaminobutyrate--2-oxoglutarate transaminase [Aliidiomarina halalkaliphila]TRW48893.1 diaminobutyrate--2-oxoglutarate transaminase [Aliidiomarina halalkaliphila]